jgi:molecular chaperone GrpE
MNSNNNPENMEDFSEEIEMDDLASIDDFIKELEAREKDLHISSEMVIEIEDSDYDDMAIEEFIQDEMIGDITPSIEPVGKINPVDFIGDEQTSELEKEITLLVNEITLLKGKISKMEADRTELFELSRRRQTDFDNYKKRTERDRSEIFNTQLGNLAMEILPVLDNLNRAMNSAASLTNEKTPDFQQFFDGVALVNQQLKEVLMEMGIKPINAVGEKFDPHFHEAVATEETDEFPSNTVIDELLRGYLLGEKVIRPSMVKVSTALNLPAGTSPSETPQV